MGSRGRSKPPPRRGARNSSPASHRNVSLPRALSKLGVCSRTQADELIRGGRVRVNGEVERGGAARVDPERDRIEVDGRPVAAQEKIYLMLNKPGGMLTTRSDERGRPTVYDCLKGAGLPWVGPVGRLDKASEGLLLFTNDTRWAARVQAPETGPDKIYHVQIEGEASQELLKGMARGTTTEGDFLRAKKATVLRGGSRNTWLEVVLDEGRNRQIRRLLSALGANVLRLIRVSIGPLNLGSLPKGAYRYLTGEEKNFFDY